jgi:hypothetical protein
MSISFNDCREYNLVKKSPNFSSKNKTFSSWIYTHRKRLLDVIYFRESGDVLKELGTGDFFGEIGILNLSGGQNRQDKAL